MANCFWDGRTERYEVWEIMFFINIQKFVGFPFGPSRSVTTSYLRASKGRAIGMWPKRDEPANLVHIPFCCNFLFTHKIEQLNAY
jgi:hypothetical protein